MENNVGFYFKNRGQTAKDAIYFTQFDYKPLDRDSIYHINDLAISACTYAHCNGWDWTGECEEVITLIIDNHEFDFKVSFDLEPVFYAEQIFKNNND